MRLLRLSPLIPRLESWFVAAAVALALLLAGPAQAQSAGFDLAALTELLSKSKRGEALFTEKRSVSLLEKSLESSGRLSFSAPDTFVRETLKPRHEKVEVVGNRVTMTTGTRVRSMRLDALPEAAIMAEAIRGTLMGNRQALETNFITTVTGQPKAWGLQLVPMEPQLREMVRSVQITGSQSLVREVEVFMADGDRSVMTIEHLPAAAGTAASTRN